MVTHAAMLTVLPNGTRDRYLKASIYVTPRLDAGGGGELGDFEAFVDWPDRITELVDRGGLALRFSGGPTIVAERDMELPARTPELDLWTLLFPKSTPVRTRALLDLADRRWRSYPFRQVLGAVKGLYRDVASQSPTVFPELGGLLEELGRLGHMARSKKELYGPLESDGNFIRTSEKHGGGVLDQDKLSSGPLGHQLAAFSQHARFYDRPGTQIGKDDPVPPAPDPVKLDFHDACTALADYPELLRRLGLVLDVLVPNDVPSDGRVRVELGDAGELSFLADEAMRPWTRYLIPDRRVFMAEPKKTGDLRDNMLNMHRERHVVTDLDVDGSGSKYLNFAATVTDLANHASSMDPDGASLPALRNGGLTVARVDRALMLATHVAAVSDREDTTAKGAPAELWADDITRGYRVDVRDDRTGRWWSLCRRVGDYRVERDGQVTTLEVDPDEGYVKGSAATSTPESLPGSDDDLYLHEAVFGWDGWSLVAPRPGELFPTAEGEDLSPATGADNPCGLTVFFRPQLQSLPALRFGRVYELRARAVDLAGNSWNYDDPAAPEDTATPKHPYLRWEPVPAPALTPRRPFGEGESVRRLVVRSTLGETTGSYVGLARVKNLTDHGTTSGADNLDRSYHDVDQRHVLPPKTAIQIAELHGEFDAALGDKPQSARNQALNIATREAGTLFDVPGAAIANFSDPPTSLPLPERGTPLKEGEHVVVDSDSVPLPYLADVLARGAAVAGLPGGPAVVEVPFGGPWPKQEPFRVDLVEGPSGHAWDASKRVLTVRLAQAEMVTVRLSCHLAKHPDGSTDLDLLAVWDLLPSDLQTKFRALALAGQHWMLTPGVDLTFVHAVEKPLSAPVFSLSMAQLDRRSGETFAAMTGTLAVHAKSTGRLDIAASWIEPVDDVLRAAPSTLDGHAHVGDVRIERTEDIVQLGRDETLDASPPVHRVRHEFGDTKHRLVSYSSVATTRYREYFPREITDVAELITHAGPATEVHVRSSRRPDPPEVLYTLPTFRWEEGNDALAGLTLHGARPARGGIHRTRRGGGLRVYLDRPWWSSGADEHLGVVVANQAPPITFGTVLTEAGINEAVLRDAARRVGVRGMTAKRLERALAEAMVEHATPRTSASLVEMSSLLVDSGLISVLLSGDTSAYVTQWGIDPIWSPQALPAGPRIQSFVNATRWDTDLSLAEVPFGQAAVAAFEPVFDPDRRLWYCDIDVASGDAYFPFIRLALARYQPYSIPGAELSRVVLAEWAQLTPDRTTTLRRVRRGDGATVTVRGLAAYNDVTDRAYRPDPSDPAGLDDSRLVIAQVERLRSSAGTDLGWERVGDRIVLRLGSVHGAHASWTGTVPFPTPARGWRYRLAVEEHELYETDESQAEYWDVLLSDPQTIDLGTFGEVEGIRFPTRTPLRSRLVYADHFPLVSVDGRLHARLEE
jgi:hypothetical protein